MATKQRVIVGRVGRDGSVRTDGRKWRCSCGDTTVYQFSSENVGEVVSSDNAPACSADNCFNELKPPAPRPRRVRTAPALVAAGPEDILTEALRITGPGGDRCDSYDHPRNNFTKIAAVWSLIFGVTVEPRQVAQAMIGMKLVRDVHKPKRDNLVDIAGYARTAERLDEPAGPGF